MSRSRTSAHPPRLASPPVPVALALLLTLAWLAPPLHAQSKRPLTFADFIAMPVVGDPQPSPDGKLVAYTVTGYSLQDNRATTRVWLADRTSGATRALTSGPGSDRQPRWSRDGRQLAFISTRESGAQLWVMPAAGGAARRLTSLENGASDPVWLPDGSALLVVSDVRWPPVQVLDSIHGPYPTEARLWTELLYRHWNAFRAGRRQHLFRVDAASGDTRDLTPVDRDVPTIATGGDGDVAVSPDGKEIAVAMHGDTVVADNTNVDVYLMGAQGGGMLPLTAGNRGADHQPRWSPDGKWLAYVSLQRPGFESDRRRLMLVGRSDGKQVEATAGWDLSVGQYAWCPDSRCVYATVEERGRVNIYRISVPSFQRSRVVGNAGVNTGVQVTPGNQLVYLHQSATQPAEIWVSGRPLTRHSDSAVAGLDLAPLEEFGFVGALGDSVYGWLLKPPRFDPSRRYPVVHVIHGGPQGAWLDNWHARWNYQMFAARGHVVAAVNFHGSTGYGQKFTDAISGNWGGHPYDDLMKSVDVLSQLAFIDSSRMAAAGGSYGGYMIYWIAGHTDRFRALVAHDGVVNPVSMYGSTEELWFMEWEFGGTPYDNRSLYERWSPLNFVTRWKTPILIVHGQNDYRVDVSESYQAFTAARKMNLPAQFLYFPDEDHWVTRPRNRRVWWSTVLDWIDRHIGAAPSQP